MTSFTTVVPVLCWHSLPFDLPAATRNVTLFCCYWDLRHWALPHSALMISRDWKRPTPLICHENCFPNSFWAWSFSSVSIPLFLCCKTSWRWELDFFMCPHYDFFYSGVHKRQAKHSQKTQIQAMLVKVANLRLCCSPGAAQYLKNGFNNIKNIS